MKKTIIILFSFIIFSVTYSKGLWKKYLIRMEKFKPPYVNEKMFLDLLAKKYDNSKKDLSFLLKKGINDQEGAIRKASLIILVKNKIDNMSRILVEKIPLAKNVTEKKWFIWAFGELGTSDDVLALTAYLRDEQNPYTLNLMAVAISKIAEKSGSVTPLMMLAKNSKNLYVKSTSIIGIAKIGDARAFPMMWKLATTHETKEIRFCAILALSEVMKNAKDMPEKVQHLKNQFEDTKSVYEKLSIAFTLQKVVGFDKYYYQYIVAKLKDRFFGEVSLDFLENLPFREGKDRLEIAAVNYPQGMLKRRINELVLKLRRIGRSR